MGFDISDAIYLSVPLLGRLPRTLPAGGRGHDEGSKCGASDSLLRVINSVSIKT